MRVSFNLNGTARSLDLPPLRRLLDVLREDLELRGTKEGCGEGECGACTVMVDGEAQNSCLIPVCQIDGADLLTIEAAGLERIQDAFLDEGGAQCGICTPGMIMATKAYLDEVERAGEQPTLAAAREAIAGNLCRCTGYAKILAAVEATAVELNT